MEKNATLRIALASPPVAGSIAGALAHVARLTAEAAASGADLVCFPETYVPGLRGWDFAVETHDPAALDAARARACEIAQAHGIHVILPMEWGSPAGLLNAAFVISDQGALTGCQAKVQLAPEEEAHYAAGEGRQLFACRGIPFGIAICHEGWRYPETVRWAAARGAKIVFHPTLTGSDQTGRPRTTWDAAEAPFVEKAMVCRAAENRIFFASVNYALRYQESATAVIGPEGDCLAWLPYGSAGLLITDVDTCAADGLYAARLKEGA